MALLLLANTGQLFIGMLLGLDDGLRGTLLGIVAHALALEAKHVGSSDSSPFVPGSKAPDFLRERVLADVRDELERYRDVALSGETPVRGVEVITNDPRAVPTLQELIDETGAPARVIVRP